jgi:hypothetical protein
MVDIPLENATDAKIAHAYRIATEIFKKPIDAEFYGRLQRQGRQMLEEGIEQQMDPMKFYACAMGDRAQFWIEIRKHKENYAGKQADFENAIKAYFA